VPPTSCRHGAIASLISAPKSRVDDLGPVEITSSSRQVLRGSVMHFLLDPEVDRASVRAFCRAVAA
jgi:hypothetical protein